MEVCSRQLAGGVELILIPTRKFKTSLFSVTLTVPLREETATANALVGEVLSRGSRLRPNMEALSAACDDLFGMALEPMVRQKGESQCVGLASSFLDDAYALDGEPILERALALMGEVLLDPAVEDGVFYKDYVKSEGANLADAIRAQINNKRGWSIRRVIEVMCEGEAYAIDKLGSAHEAEAMTPQALWVRYQALLKEAGVVFYYAGPAPAERVERAVRASFAPLLTPRRVQNLCQVAAHPRGAVREETDRMDVNQGKLAMGFRTGGITADSPEYPALMVCSAIYGGTASSKLFLNVRERLSLCYFVGSMVDKLKGVMVVSSGVDPANFDVAREEILRQLRAVQEGDFTGEELSMGVQSLVSSLRTMQDSHGRMEDFWLTQRIAGLTAGPEELMESIRAVTREQVAAAAKKLELDAVYYLAGEEK